MNHAIALLNSGLGYNEQLLVKLNKVHEGEAEHSDQVGDLGHHPLLSHRIESLNASNVDYNSSIKILKANQTRTSPMRTRIIIAFGLTLPLTYGAYLANSVGLNFIAGFLVACATVSALIAGDLM